MKIKQLKIINQDESTKIADIGANAENVDYNNTNVKLKLDELSNNVDTNTTNISNEMITRANEVTNLQSQVNGLASGSPLVASSVSGMTNTNRVYVNTSNGHWYTYNGSTWVDGGIYQSAGIENGSITPIKTNFMEEINKIPLKEWTNNKILDYSTGVESNFTNASYSKKYIEIPYGKTKIVTLTHNTTNNRVALYFYDEEKTFLTCISNLNNNTVTSIPSNAKYFRIGFQAQLGYGDYIILYYEDFIKGLNVYNNGKLKDKYVNLDCDKILYNMKKLNILPTVYDEGIAVPTINGNSVNYAFTNAQTSNGYIGILVNWNIKVGDVITLEVDNNFPATQFNIFKTRENILQPALSSQGGNLGRISIINGKASLTITSELISKIVNNSLFFTFLVPTGENGTNYNFNIKVSLNDDYYYFNDFILNNYTSSKEYKAMFLGDSITALTGNRAWWEYFNRIINVTDCVNVAVNGARLRDFADTVYDGNPTSHSNNNVLGNQVQKIINNQNTYITPDFIFIAIGTNDGISATIDDGYNAYYDSNNTLIPISNVNRQTDAGAFRYCNEKLHTLYPNAMIVWCTPIQAENSIRNVKSILNYGNSLKNLCATGSVYCIDTEKCGINGINEVRNSNGQYLIDGLHPNSAGAEKMGNFNASEFKKFLEVL